MTVCSMISPYRCIRVELLVTDVAYLLNYIGKFCTAKRTANVANAKPLRRISAASYNCFELVSCQLQNLGHTARCN